MGKIKSRIWPNQLTSAKNTANARWLISPNERVVWCLFLEDLSAREEYDNFTIVVKKHFTQLDKITRGSAEKAAINDLHASYQEFVFETSALFDQNKGINNDATKNAIKHALNTGIETGLFKRYEEILARTEKLLNQQQIALNKRLEETKRTSTILLIIPLF